MNQGFADFLSQFHLLVDVVHRRLVNADSYLSSPIQPAPLNLTLHNSIPRDAYAHLITSYLEVFRPELRQTPTAPAKRSIYYHIKMTGPPFFAKFRHLAPDRLAATKQTFAEMEEMGLCQKTSSPWSSPLHIVPKKDSPHRLHCRHSGSLLCLPQGQAKRPEVGFLQEVAFCNAKIVLSTAAALTFPVPHALLLLSTDASNVAISAVLDQVVNNSPRPLAFFSRKISKAESGYSTFDRELLAEDLAVRHFHHFLEGTPFVIQTDHMPLVNTFTWQSDVWSPSQRRYLSAVAECNCTLQHVPGKMNPVADALSRNTLAAVQLVFDYIAMAKARRQDPEYQFGPQIEIDGNSQHWDVPCINRHSGLALLNSFLESTKKPTNLSTMKTISVALFTLLELTGALPAPEPSRRLLFGGSPYGFGGYG
ncbi:uncharacterized protein [Palaemon carinicauda]|uniref:uncharacterized protein n=1 Tax=Palaemon carinicauda TaxID=392227 RepID=UPI0035B570A4